VLPTKVFYHIDMPSGGLVRWMQAHRDSTFIIAEDNCRLHGSESMLLHQHSKVMSFLSESAQYSTKNGVKMAEM